MKHCLAVVLFLYGAVCAQTPSVDESLNATAPMSTAVSPDGKYVAYTVQETNWTDNAFVQQIWIANASTAETYKLTSGSKSSDSPKWSRDVRRLAFLSERDGKKQIYVISPSGGEAAQLTAEESGIVTFDWSPDGKTIAFVSPGPESKEKKARKDRFGDFEVFEGDYTMSHLWKVAVPGDIPADPKARPKPEAITDGRQFSVQSFEWSPDGRQIAFSAARDPDLASTDTLQVYVVDLADKHVRKISEGSGPNSAPVWSPDAKQIAFLTANGEKFFYYSNSRIAIVPVEGGRARIITASFDEDPRLHAWTPKGIYFSALQKTALQLFRLDPVTSEYKIVTAPKNLSVPGLSLTPDGTITAAIGAAPNHFGEVFISSTGDFAPKYLTHFEDQWKKFRLGTREVVTWKSKDGTPIEGVLIKPPDYDPARKYPLLVVIHGGPTGIDTPTLSADRYYPVERFLAKGALVLKPNYRGSAGYGEKFRSLNVRNLGLGDFEDVVSGVDYLIARGIVDKDRLGAMGWSQGGYISAFISTYSNRFKAVSVGAGISDWATYYVNTDIHPFTRQYLKATPWEDPEIYSKTSPITYVNRASTPTLIQHGDQDKRVPPPNAFELYRALQDRGVPSRLILYKGFGHPINKPKQQRAVMEHNYEWFTKYIWGEQPTTDLSLSPAAN